LKGARWRQERFTKQSPGKLIRALPLNADEMNVMAFVPHELPPDVAQSNELFNITAEVSNALGRPRGKFCCALGD
jgi:hypothetical protein